MIDFRTLTLGAVALTAFASAASASTVILTGGEGWQYGQDDTQNARQSTPTSIQLDVTNPNGAEFSLTDGFLAGDVYKISVSIGPFTVTGVSTFTGYNTNFNNNTGPAAGFFAADWTNNAFSHYQIDLSPGVYTVTVRDISNIAYPAGFGFRLDAVPEPASWALLMAGFGGLGAVLRFRRRAIVA